MPVKNRKVSLATAAFISTLLFVVTLSVQSRSIRTANVEGVSPKWVFTAGDDNSATAVAAETPLIEPHSLIVGGRVPKAEVDIQIIAARRYDTFWNTGDDALARRTSAELHRGGCRGPATHTPGHRFDRSAQFGLSRRLSDRPCGDSKHAKKGIRVEHGKEESSGFAGGCSR